MWKTLDWRVVWAEYSAMLNLARHLLWMIGAFVLSLRYRVHVTGLEKVRGITHALVLPNHPGYVDPPLVLKTVWPALRPRPLLLGSMFNSPLIFWLPKLLDAVEIPELEQASAAARDRTQTSLAVIIDGLKSGRNHVLWPSGRVYRTVGRESLGAARSLSEILQAVPEAKLVLVRTRGVWGSMFSYARKGGQPNLGWCLIKGAGILLANLIFFAPRRKIEITLEPMERSQLPGIFRERLNPFLDAWYNAPGEEQPVHVPYHFLFGSRHYEFPKPAGPEAVDVTNVRKPTRKTVANMLAEKLKREPGDAEMDPASELGDLGLDSLDRMELLLDIEQRFGFRSDDVPTTVGGLWAVAEGLSETRELKPAGPAWLKQPAEKSRLTILDETLLKSFVKRCIQARHDMAAVDDVSGMVSYERMLIASLLLAKRIRQMPGTAVGILLPASVAACSTYFAVLMAGKTPVLLNWTTGPGNLAHAAQVMKLQRVITSRKFVDRIGVTIAGTEYVHLEELRGGIGKVEMLRGLLRVRLQGESILKHLPEEKPEQTAVVLFTSGSEKAPKAVPLTHRNIISNLSAALDAFHLTNHDSLIGFLPPFHSFGLSVTTVLPVLTGARVAYHPDPTDAATIARKIAVYRTTILLGTPTFVSLIVNRCRDHDLAAVRLAVVGAEKCPPSLFEAIARIAPRATLLEGYGITECAPIVAANREESHKPGTVGLPLSNVKLKIVDVETHAALAQGQTGMLLIHGPNVFPGYLDESTNPFVEQDGLRWYLSGDLANIDEQGFVTLAGRLKRFIKAGGEMISLPAIEEPLSLAFPSGDEGPRVAVEGIESHEGRKIVLFTTENISLRQANELLQSKGLRGIMRLDEVRRLEKLPVLGTGKTDYKQLRAMITL